MRESCVTTMQERPFYKLVFGEELRPKNLQSRAESKGAILRKTKKIFFIYKIMKEKLGSFLVSFNIVNGF